MKRLNADPGRLRKNNPRYPVDLIFMDGNDQAKCKYCGRSPLVAHFDFRRTIDCRDEFCCYECYKEGRHIENPTDGIITLGYILSGLKEYDFPIAPEPGTPRMEVAGKCDVCGELVFYDPYKRLLIDAYHELLRNIYVHNKCDIVRKSNE